MEEIGELMSIGVFARRVGLAPSALRFYDDCGVLRPARTDATTGYRYYAPDQEHRAVLVRRLREAGIPLTDASAVLDGSPEEARAVLQEHARRTRETAASVQSAIEEILLSLPGCVPWTRARVGGAELAGAVRQVAPAVARDKAREEFPALGRVLVELDRQEVRLAATDRYRLAVHSLRTLATEGEPRRVLVDAAEMKDAAEWALRLPEVVIETDGRSTRLRGEGTERALPAVEEEFPDYRPILDGLPAVRHRIITGRTALSAALAERCGPVTLHADGQRLALTSRDTSEADLPALCTGPALRISFDPRVLLPALDAGVGPDTLLEVASPTGPVVVRSADQGDFTTLVMPVLNAP